MPPFFSAVPSKRDSSIVFQGVIISILFSRAGPLWRRWVVFFGLRHMFLENGLSINMVFSSRSLKPAQSSPSRVLLDKVVH
jgi:hypothetical protein